LRFSYGKRAASRGSRVSSTPVTCQFPPRTSTFTKGVPQIPAALKHSEFTLGRKPKRPPTVDLWEGDYAVGGGSFRGRPWLFKPTFHLPPRPLPEMCPTLSPLPPSVPQPPPPCREPLRRSLGVPLLPYRPHRCCGPLPQAKQGEQARSGSPW
jgi:hypothetical protein